jgi:hypothetical protein
MCVERSGLRLINPDTFFADPKVTINNFVQSTGTLRFLPFATTLTFIQTTLSRDSQISPVVLIRTRCPSWSYFRSVTFLLRHSS